MTDPSRSTWRCPQRYFQSPSRHFAALGFRTTVSWFSRSPSVDLEGALALNQLLLGLVDERHVFRVDHFLAMSTVRNVLGTRLANRVLEPIWNNTHIGEIEIVWEKSLALEGRAGYYDQVGALKDMAQNHLLQVLCLVAMEPPVSLESVTCATGRWMCCAP